MLGALCLLVNLGLCAPGAARPLLRGSRPPPAGFRAAARRAELRHPMCRRMRSICALLFLGAFALGYAGDLTALESQKIEFLIASIQTLGDAKFVRNGTAYDAKTAAHHLRLKLKNAESKVKSADDFIRFCGSVSSISGVPYQIRYADGRVVTSEAFFREKLLQYPAQGGGSEPR